MWRTWINPRALLATNTSDLPPFTGTQYTGVNGKQYFIWVKKAVCFLLLLTILTGWLPDRGSETDVKQKKANYQLFFLLQKYSKLLPCNEQYTSIVLRTERSLTYDNQHNNWDSFQRWQNLFPSTFVTTALLIPLTPGIRSQDFHLWTMAFPVQTQHVLCSHPLWLCCSHWDD